MNRAPFPVEILTPNTCLFSENVQMAVLPGSEGEFGVLSQHAPLAAELRHGAIKLYQGGDEPTTVFNITGGFAHVTPEKCTVIADGIVTI